MPERRLHKRSPIVFRTQIYLASSLENIKRFLQKKKKKRFGEKKNRMKKIIYLYNSLESGRAYENPLDIARFSFFFILPNNNFHAFVDAGKKERKRKKRSVKLCSRSNEKCKLLNRVQCTAADISKILYRFPIEKSFFFFFNSIFSFKSKIMFMFNVNAYICGRRGNFTFLNTPETSRANIVFVVRIITFVLHA